jgi:hypothetical protein
MLALRLAVFKDGMRKFLFATAVSVTLETGFCALASAETWSCVGAKVIIDLDQRRVELSVPSLSYDVLIVDGARGPLGGKCPVVCGNSQVPFEQFVDFNDDSFRFGFRAYIGCGGAQPLRQSFQHGCDFRSHPTCRLSLPRRTRPPPIPLQTATNEAYCYGL